MIHSQQIGLLGAHCCRNSALPYKRETASVRDCELACLEVTKCLFFSHSAEHRLCNLCERCTPDMYGKRFSSFRLTAAMHDRDRSLVLLDAVFWRPPPRGSSETLRQVFWVHFPK